MTSASDERTGQNHIQGLERGLAVLQAFDAEHPDRTTTELATATQLSRPVVRRILLTLQRLGYVATSDGRWTLTPRVLSIGQHYTATHALTEVAQPHLMRLAEQTGESSTLATLDDNEVVYIARMPVRRVLSVTVAPGTRAAAHATSLGRVLLAWESTERIERIITESGLPGLTPYTVTDPVQFREILSTVRHQGWSMLYAARKARVNPGALTNPHRAARPAIVCLANRGFARSRRAPSSRSCRINWLSVRSWPENNRCTVRSDIWCAAATDSVLRSGLDRCCRT